MSGGYLDRNFQFQVEHVSIAKQADVVMIAPASANVIGKLAHGIADDMLTTTVMACKCKKYISPAMNTNMYENPILQDNLKILRRYDYEVIDPAVGYLACGDTGAGKMPEPEILLQYILKEIACEKDLKGKKVLSLQVPLRRPLIRSAILPITPQAKWDMPWPELPCCGELRLRW